MGLHVDVYRSAARNADCTLNGITHRFNRLCLINVEGPFSPDETHAPALLLRGNLHGTVKIVPADEQGNPVQAWTMFGGNYATTSDSRFSEACERITGNYFYGAVAVHDRIES